MNMYTEKDTSVNLCPSYMCTYAYICTHTHVNMYTNAACICMYKGKEICCISLYSLPPQLGCS